jgi:hypothetical protein
VGDSVGAPVVGVPVGVVEGADEGSNVGEAEGALVVGAVVGDKEGGINPIGVGEDVGAPVHTVHVVGHASITRGALHRPLFLYSLHLLSVSEATLQVG